MSINIGDTVLCIKSKPFLPIVEGQHYTVSGNGTTTNPDDGEFVQIAEQPGAAFRVSYFETTETV